MERVKQPQTPQKLVPIMGNDDTKKLLDSTKGKTFMALRDEALIRLYYNTGAVRACALRHQGADGRGFMIGSRPAPR